MDKNHQYLLQPYPLFSLLRDLAQQEKIPVYVVGGFVRDAFLRKNCKDIDIVCVGDGIGMAETFSKQFKNSQVNIFKRFGTAMVMWNGFQVEFVSARKESYTENSRKPTVTSGSLQDDIFRRDFTINALAISLNHDSFGQLIDLCHGSNDIQRRRICTPKAPEKTFSDDPLRILRGVRFAVQLGFRIDQATLKAMRQQVTRMKIVSKERIITELNKIMLSPNPGLGLRLLDRIGLLKIILPELESLKGKETINGLSHKDNFIHTIKVVDNLVTSLKGINHPRRLWLVWATLLHDIAKPATKHFDPQIGFSFHGHEKLGAKMVPTIFRRLGLPLKQDMRYVQKLIRLHMRHIPLVEQQATDSAVRRFLLDVGEELDDLMLLCKADITSGNPLKIATYLQNFERLAQKIDAVEIKDRIRNFKPAITGDIIMRTFNLTPSHKVGLIKETVKEAILDGKIPNEYQPAYNYMITYAKTLGLLPVGG